MKDETGRDDDEAGRDETEEENEEFIPAAVKSNEEEERPRSANAEIIRTISRIGTPEIMQQETTLSEKIDETKGSDETSQLATELFGKDFAMFALNTLLMMKPKPSIPVPKVIREKSAIERLVEVLKNNKLNDAEKADSLRDIVAMLNDDRPKNFQDAYNHQDPLLREKWREAIRTEVRNMIQRGVFRRMKRRDIPGNRRCVKHKWVFEVKRSGRFRARLVACERDGERSVLGGDFCEDCG
mmetsp:Transcript_66093/g.184768  ORF Transcript_66093/g.184768 Transcript_66093/m.184768 type:complete len:241 (-) Transcript_66093:337-1059(-)